MRACDAASEGGRASSTVEVLGACASYHRLSGTSWPPRYWSDERLVQGIRFRQAERMEQGLYSVTYDDSHVEAWSTVRLPFEPKGWLHDYRRELQAALRSMTATPTSVLYAKYGTPGGGLADLENVLLYNLGSGCYAHLAELGIVCRRTPSLDGLHRVSYTSMEPADVTLPSGKVLAAARLVEMPSGGTPAHWWAAFSDHLETRDDKLYEGEFAIRAAVGSAWKRSLAPSVKSFLDGLIAALHVHDGSGREHLTAALDEIGEGDLLWELLNDPAKALFGRRRLVRPHGSRIAWNPADERCGYFELLRGTQPGALTVTVIEL